MAQMGLPGVSACGVVLGAAMYSDGREFAGACMPPL